VSEAGHKTFHAFEPDVPVDVRYVMGVAACPDSFGRVEDIEALDDHRVAIQDEDGRVLQTNVDWRFLHEGNA
jgi:hypothetical protein